MPQLTWADPVWGLKSFWKKKLLCISPEVIVLFLAHKKKRKEEGKGGMKRAETDLLIPLMQRNEDLDWAPSHPPPTTSLPVRENFLRKCTCTWLTVSVLLSILF